MDNYIFGRNSVIEYLKTDQEAEKLFIQKGQMRGAMYRIIALAKERGLLVVEADAKKLDRLAEGQNHQGVVLMAQDYAYSTLDEILQNAEQKGHDPFVILLDEITDPHNLGAIIRSAECAGADGVLIPKHRSAGVTSVVHKTSSGATTYMRVAKIASVNATIDRLKKENIWIYGAAGEAKQTIWETDFSGGVCLVIGNEGKGLSRLTKEKCDVLVSIPMRGKLDSLNASTAAGIIMYEVLRGRLKK